MVKLLWQLGAWSLAFYSIYLWTTADPATPHGIRDGLLVAVISCLLSLRQSNRFALTRTRTLIEQPTAGGQLVLWTGIICLLVGSLMEGQISATPTVALLSGTILWWIGATLLTVAVVWPKAWRNARHPTMVLPENRDTPADGRRAQDDLHDPVAAISQPAPDATGAPVAGRTIPGVNWLSLLFVLLIGSGIRWLIMAQLPAFCVGTACEAALAVSEGMPTSSLPLLIAQWLNPWLDQGFLSVRLATVLLALLGLMSFYLLARRLVSSGGALLGTFLLLLTPWIYTLDAGALPALTLFFWFPLALWLLLTAWQRQQPRWAIVGGIALGLATQVPLFQVALLLWLLLLTLLTIFLTKRDITRLLSALLALLGFLISTLPTFIELGGVAALLRDTLRGAPFSSTEWLIALFQPGLLALTQWADLQWVGVPPLTLVLGGATVVGLGALLRNLRDPLAGWLTGGWVIAALLFVYTGNNEGMAESTILFVLFSLLVATVAFHGLLTTFYQSWRPLLPLANAVALACLLLLLFSLNPMRNLWEQSGQRRAAGQSATEQAILTHMAELLAVTPDLTIFAPASLLENPATRLHLGEAAAAQLQPLAAVLNTLYTTDVPQDAAYFIPAGAQPYQDLIQRIYPGAMRDLQLDPQTGEALYTLLTTNAADLLAQQGLVGVAWENNADGTNTSHVLPAFGPLALDPATIPALRSPFSLQWTGALRIAAPGTYRFTLEFPTTGAAPNATTNAPVDSGGAQASTLSLQLDNRLILDSVLGLTEQEVMLAKGFYQLTLLLHAPASAAPATDVPADDFQLPTPFAIRWQRPDGREEIIPQSVLYKLPLPNVGLIGEYYDDTAPQSAPFDIRKDLVVGLVRARQAPYHVRWRGQLAAPRTGEYLLAALGSPTSATQLTLDGLQLFDTRLATVSTDGTAPADADTTPLSSYAEGTIYLQQGWHDLVIEYQPDATAPAMQLFWQPPGSGPTPLDATYLAPSLTPLTTGDRPLPQAPPLAPAAGINAGAVDGNSGSNRGSSFALSYGTEYWQPQVQVPPAALPALPFEMAWQVGSCGSGAGELAQPHGVALSGIRGLIYVADTANQRAVEYTLDGTVNRVYTNVEWREPVAVALLDKGFPVVLDAERQSLTNLNPATGGVEPRPVQTSFYYPRGLAVDRAGNLWVADTGGGRVAQFTPSGELLQSLGGPETTFGRGQPTDVVEAGGILWAVTAEDGRLWQPLLGGSITAIERTNTINGPHLAGLADGSLFLSDPVRRSVLYLAATGEPLAAIHLPNLIEPTGIAVAPVDDLLYLAVVDTAGCQLSLWRTDPARLAVP